MRRRTLMRRRTVMTISTKGIPRRMRRGSRSRPHRRPHRRVVGPHRCVVRPHRCVVRPHRRPHSRRRRRRTRTRTRMLLHRRRGCGRHRGSRQSGACRRPHRRPHRRVVRQHHGTHHTEAKECRQHQRRGAATKGGHGGAATVARICELGHLMSLSQRSIRHCTARAT